MMVEGIFTHFARADEADKAFTFYQMEQFKKMIAMMDARNVTIPIHHCSNSAGIVEIPEANMNMVRAGITLYGLWPSDEVDKAAITLKPALELKSHVAYVKCLEAGRAISYGGTYTTETDRLIATIPVGYGDGYCRGLSNKGSVLIHGRRAPICGRICMDQFMADVTDIPDVQIGDEVTLIGKMEQKRSRWKKSERYPADLIMNLSVTLANVCLVSFIKTEWQSKARNILNN